MATVVPTLGGPQVASRPIGTPQVRATPVDNSGLESASRGLDAAGKIFQKSMQEADSAAVIDAESKLNAWKVNTMFNKDNGVYTKKGQNALDITNQTIGSYDQQAEEITNGLTNDRQKQRFKAIAASQRNSLNADLNQYEYKERQTFYNDTDKASIQLSQDSAALYYNDPNKVAYYRDKALAVADQQAQRNGWSDEEKQLHSLNTSSKLLTGVIGQMANDNPDRAKQYFETARDGMNAEDQLRAGSVIQQKIKQQDAEARQRMVEQRQLQAIARSELHDRVQDASAAYLQGFQFQNPPNKADFQAAYGDKGAERYADFEKIQTIAPAIRDFATATPQEREKILSDFQPAKDGVAGEGFTEDNSLYQHLTSVASGLVRQQQQDPGAYVAKYSTPIRQALTIAQQDGTPESWTTYFNSTVAEQRRQGIQNVKLLPDAMANQIAAQFNTTVASGQGDNAAQQIEQMQAQWGKNFGSVMQQIGNKLPAEAQVIATGLPKDVAERMASVAPIKDADLNKGLQQGQAKDIQQRVASAMQDFAGTLRGQSGGIETYTTMYNAAVRTTTAYVLQGTAPDKAAQKVVSGMVNDKYDFFDTYRVPKDLDTGAIRVGANRALSEINSADLMPLTGLRGVMPEENAKQLESAIRDNGEWVTNGDESGLTLTLNGYAVRDKSGRPVQKTWQQLQSDSAKVPRAKDNVVYPWTITP